MDVDDIRSRIFRGNRGYIETSLVELAAQRLTTTLTLAIFPYPFNS